MHSVNAAITTARPRSKLHGIQHLVDPPNEIIGVEVHLASLQWDYKQCKFCLTGAASGLKNVHALSVELLYILEEILPEKFGGILGWNFKKPHSIIHKVHARLCPSSRPASAPSARAEFSFYIAGAHFVASTS